MLGKKLQSAINEQIKNELYSGYLYLAMSAYFEAGNLPGFARWMRLQAEEEQEHALKFFDFVNERGGRVELQAIDQPPVEFKSPLAVFEQVLEHEKKVTGLINQLYLIWRYFGNIKVVPILLPHEIWCHSLVAHPLCQSLVLSCSKLTTIYNKNDIAIFTTPDQSLPSIST